MRPVYPTSWVASSGKVADIESRQDGSLTAATNAGRQWHPLRISHNKPQFWCLPIRNSRARIANGQHFQIFMQDFMRAIDYK
jgi:hypothetical protein